MQDRFLTRYYDTETQQIIKLNKIINCCENGTEIEFYGITVSGEGQISQVELDKNDFRFKRMQCTGLKDDNSNLIFEGDIVEVRYIDAQIPLFKNEYTQEPDAEIFEIAYSEEWHTFVAKNDNYKKTCEVYSLDLSKIQINKDNKIYKIVGNIYENADLLEVKDADIQS